jgi:hypothetical protein
MLMIIANASVDVSEDLAWKLSPYRDAGAVQSFFAFS